MLLGHHGCMLPPQHPEPWSEFKMPASLSCCALGTQTCEPGQRAKDAAGLAFETPCTASAHQRLQ